MQTKTKGLTEQHVDALWNKAHQSGVPRRKFLILLAAGGATAVLAACTRAAPTTTTPVQTPTSTSPSPTEAPRAIYQPVPDQFFIPLGTNAETRLQVMATRTYQTPQGLYFIRDHSSSPFIDIKTWKMTVEGDGISTPLTLTYDDLLKLPSVTVTRYVECAGNGRSFFSSLLNNPAQGGQWHLGAYGIADWTGVRLSEILRQAGLKSNAVDVMPTGLDTPATERPMPVEKAMEDDVILAYFMNQDILPVDHGFPVRALVPGWVGVSSIKWVGKITVSTQPIHVDKNTTSYVLVGPDYEAQGPALGPPVTTQVMKSAICLPFPATFSVGQHTIVGYAWSPAGRITAVDVSLDGGQTFQSATLRGSNIEKAGTRWEFSFNAQPGETTITPRASDDKGNVQYPVSQQKWNQQGYLFGAMVPHPVTVS